MDHFVIWRNLGYRAFHDNVIPAIINRLIQNNIQRGLLIFDQNTRRVNLSDTGLTRAEMNCARFPY